MTVIITGASRGIGKGLAYEFASHKYNLVLTCEKNIDDLHHIKNDIENIYKVNVFTKKGLLEEGDITDDIYILINNAGKCDYNLIQDTTYEKFKEITYANLDYAFLTTKLVVKKLIKNKQGIIINISSMWGILGSSFESTYSMTKGGINAWTKSLAKELKDSNVDVVAFALGAVDTDMNSHMTDDEKNDFIKTLDGEKMFSKETISKMIYDIVSSKKYNTGDIIEINNGLA